MPVGVQNCTVLPVIDRGASRTLISARDYEALPQPSILGPPGTLVLVAGNNPEISLLGWIRLRFLINTRCGHHDFGEVKTLTIDIFIGAEFLRPHDCQIICKASGSNAFGKMHGYCDPCLRKNDKIEGEHDPQLQPTPERSHAKYTELSCVVVSTILPDEQAPMSKKQCNWRAELKIDQISFRDSIRHQVLSVLARLLDAVALDHDDDVGRTLIENLFETGNHLPFRQKARPLPYAPRSFIEVAG